MIYFMGITFYYFRKQYIFDILLGQEKMEQISWD